MNKIKFYTILSILNILLTLYNVIGILGAFYLMFYDLFSTPEKIFLCGITIYIVCVVLKLLLPRIFIICAGKYKNSIINKFVEFIRNNPQQKKFILLLAFCFDLPFICYILSTFRHWMAILEVLNAYIIFYAGGVLIFYIMLYYEIETKAGKIKTFF